VRPNGTDLELEKQPSMRPAVPNQKGGMSHAKFFSPVDACENHITFLCLRMPSLDTSAVFSLRT